MYDAEATERTRTVVTKWISAFADRRLDELHSLFAPGAKWILVGKADRAPWAGVATGAALRQKTDNMELFDKWEYTLENLIVENDKAVAEGVGTGSGPGALYYTNTYLKRFIVNKEGKVTEVKVILDAYEVEAFGALYEEWKKTQGTKPV
ncbi:SnoaL-like domain-containing protein [Cladophialophora immunda]|nr:SnoaL-like domain-containing protein [Cladophialophora immunda]